MEMLIVFAFFSMVLTTAGISILTDYIFDKVFGK